MSGIDSLTEGDVVVVDMYDKIYKGTFLGGNLTTAIKTKTKTGGGVIWGGIRDTQQMKAFYPGLTAIEDDEEYILTKRKLPLRIRILIPTWFTVMT